MSQTKTQRTGGPHCWERVRKHGWEAPPFLWRAQTLREELKEWKPNLSIPQIKLAEPKQTIANWASARKLSEPSVCNKTLLGSLSERLTVANEKCYTGTIQAVVTNRQTGCTCSALCAWWTLLPVRTHRFPLLTGTDTSHTSYLMINSSLSLFWTDCLGGNTRISVAWKIKCFLVDISLTSVEFQKIFCEIKCGKWEVCHNRVFVCTINIVYQVSEKRWTWLCGTCSATPARHQPEW